MTANFRESHVTNTARPNILRAALAHILIAWLFVQVADVVLPYLGIVEQPIRWAVVVGVATFPVTLLVAWFIARDWPVAEIIGIVLIAALCGWWVSGNLPEAARDRTSLLVMPFAHADKDRERGLARALTFEVTNLLTRTRAIDVIAYQSSSSSVLQGMDSVAAAGRVNVRNVLEGRVAANGDSMRIELRLLSAAGDAIWESVVEDSVANLFTVQERIATEVESRLGAGDDVVAVESLAAERCWMPDDPAALQKYYTARYYTENRSSSPESRTQIAEAIRIYKGLIDQFPEFAEAYAGLAWAQGYQATYHRQDAVANLQAANAELATTALQHCPALGEARVLLPNEFDHSNRWIAEWQQLTAFMEAEPHKPEYAQKLAFHFGMTGLWDDALEVAERVVELNPLSVRAIRELASVLQKKGELQRASELYELSIELGATAPNFAAQQLARKQCGPEDLDCFMASLPGMFKPLAADFRVIYRIPENAEQAQESLELAIRRLDEVPELTNWFSGSACRFEHLTPLFFHAWERANEGHAGWFFANSWGEHCETVQSQPEFLTYVEDAGFVEYWRKVGWPAVCQPREAGFACGRNASKH